MSLLQINLGDLIPGQPPPRGLLGLTQQQAPPDGWNRLVFRDISGSGFKLQLASIKLISLRSGSGLFRLSSDDPLLTPFALTTKLPVLNQESLREATASSRYIMKLKPGATLSRVRSICDELAGRLNATAATTGGGLPLSAGGGSRLLRAPRFRGACDTSGFQPISSSFSGASSSASQSDLDAPLPWAFQSLTVTSDDDLVAMRTMLADSVEYFERDLIATTADEATATDGGASDSAAGAEDAQQNAAANAGKQQLAAEGDLIATTAVLNVNVRSWGLDRVDQLNLPLDGEQHSIMVAVS